MPLPCPGEWDYGRHPRVGELLGRSQAAIFRLRAGAPKLRALLRDCRPTHRELFTGLTPTGFDYFAGHYRGENRRCLKDYNVKIESDPRVNVLAQDVQRELFAFRSRFAQFLSELDARCAVPGITARDRVYFVVAAAAWAFVEYLRIHPYANGNGHVARFIVWAILGHYDLWPDRWPVDPRPSDPPYTDAIVAYRDGDPAPLERFIFDAIA